MAVIPSKTRATRPFHFVPDELCVVLTIESREKPELLLERGWQERLYAAVLDGFDAALRAELLRTMRDSRLGDDPYRRDLAPQRLREVVARGGRLLTDLRQSKYARKPVAGSPLEGDPWVILPRVGGPLTALHFFGLGTGDHRADPDGQALVREAANLCNRAYRRRALPLPEEFARFATVRVEAGTPNWLMGAAQAGEISGGPGSGPLPVATGEAGGPPFGQFAAGGNAALAALLPAQDRAAHQRESPDEERAVIVAVLDTCPVEGKVQIKDKLNALAGEHWLLRELHDSPHVHFDAPTFIDPTYRWDYSVNWGRWSAPHPAATSTGRAAQHEMPDHGLFAAGIVRTLAPGAEIRLIRVLDDYGVGDLLALAQVLALLPATLLGEGPLDPPGKRRLIVNLSLTAALPPDAAFLDLWFPETMRGAKNHAIFRRRFADICATLDTIQLGLRAVVDWLAARDNVLLIAAAGNDGQRPEGRPAPAAPARYDSVLGVGALRADGGAARFSNRGDIAVFGDGVAAFGGNVKPDSSGELGVIDQGANGLPDAVVGAAIAPTLPPEATPNATGWARWAGTSFAAPIVSGLAAARWSQPDGGALAAPALLAALVAIAGNSTPELDCPALALDQIRQ